MNEYMKQLRAKVAGMSPEQRLEAAAEQLRDMDRRDKKAEFWGEREMAWHYGTREALEIILGDSLDTGEYDPEADTEEEE